jgi:hypothetical protein
LTKPLRNNGKADKLLTNMAEDENESMANRMAFNEFA